MFGYFQAGARKELALQEVGEDGRNMRWIADFVHHSDFALEKKAEARGQRVDVRSGDHRDTIWSEKLGDVSQKVDGTLDVLDHFNRNDQIEGGHAKFRSESHVVQ